MKNKIIVSLLALSLLFTTSLFGDNNYYGNLYLENRVEASLQYEKSEVVTPLPDVPVNEPEPVSVDSPSPENSVEPEDVLVFNLKKQDAENLVAVGLIVGFIGVAWGISYYNCVETGNNCWRE